MSEDAELILGALSLSTQRRSETRVAPPITESQFLPEGATTVPVFLQEPQDTITGTVMAPVIVQLMENDEYGDPVEVAGIAIVLSIVGEYGTLQGTLTQITDEYGQASFDDLIIAEDGSYQLQAQVFGSVEALSASFEIALPSLVIVAQTPSDTDLTRLQAYLLAMGFPVVDILDTANLATIDFTPYDCVLAMLTENTLAIAQAFETNVLNIGLPMIMGRSTDASGQGRNTVASRLSLHNTVEVTSGSTLLRRSGTVEATVHPITATVPVGAIVFVPSGTCVQGRLDEPSTFLGVSLVVSDGVVATQAPGLIAIEGGVGAYPQRIVASYIFTPTPTENWQPDLLTLLERSVLWAVGAL